MTTTETNEQICFAVNGADPGFSALENLIICDLVNDPSYMDVVLNYRKGDQQFRRRFEAANIPSDTLLDSARRTDFTRLVVQDVLEWHVERPWRNAGFFPASGDDAELASFFAELEEAEGTTGYGCDPDNVDEDYEPTKADIAFFLKNLSADRDDTHDPTAEDIRRRQREMLALLAERFAGVLMIGSGRRIMQSLTMFVDFTVRKDGVRNLLMW